MGAARKKATDAAVRRVSRRRWGWLVLVPLLPLAVRFTPAYPWLLERAPDSLLVRIEGVSPRDPWPAVIRGERLLARGQARPALEQFERAGKQGAADSRWGIGVVESLAESGHYDRALPQAQSLLEFEPHSARLHRTVGRCRLEMGDPAGALTSLTKATDLAPREPRSWLALAQAREALEGPGLETLRVWQQGTRLNPADPVLRHGLAHLYIRLARYADAEPLVNDLPVLAPPEHPDAQALYVRAWYARGTVLRRLNPSPERLRAAEQALDRARSLDATFPDTWYELGLLHADTGDRGRAREALERAVRLKPQAPPFWYHLSMVCRKSNPQRAREAEARFRLLVRTEGIVAREADYLAAHPDDHARRLALAELLLQREDLRQAATQLGMVLRAEPQNPDARRLAARLDQRLRQETGRP